VRAGLLSFSALDMKEIGRSDVVLSAVIQPILKMSMKRL
jgi:hypothetical protein